MAVDGRPQQKAEARAVDAYEKTNTMDTPNAGINSTLAASVAVHIGTVPIRKAASPECETGDAELQSGSETELNPRLRDWRLPETRKMETKLRSGLLASGVEGFPEANSPLDPGPGLGDNFSLGQFCENASSKSQKVSHIVTAITVPCQNGPFALT
ncbi:MAG: hypothetical protein ABSC48_03360 [Terracidiphilus sp.]